MKKLILLFILIMCMLSDLYAQWTTSGSNIYNSNTGNVGVGTTSPGALLDLGLAGTLGGKIRLAGSTSGNITLQTNAIAGNSIAITLPAVTGTLPIGTGALNYVTRWTGTNTQGTGLFQDDGITTGVGSVNSGYKFFVLNTTKSAAIGGFNYYAANGSIGVQGYSYITDGAPGTMYGVQGIASNASTRSGINIGGYFTATGTGTTNYALITGSGNVGIGTSTPAASLDVNGNIFTNGTIFIGTPDAATTSQINGYSLAVNGSAVFKKAKVAIYGNWPDYVFSPGYKLTPLDSLEQFIQQNKHLPGVPSAQDVKKDGIDLGDNQALLLKKIEELTLILIEQNKKQTDLENLIVKQIKRIKKLESNQAKYEK